MADNVMIDRHCLRGGGGVEVGSSIGEFLSQLLFAVWFVIIDL